VLSYLRRSRPIKRKQVSVSHARLRIADVVVPVMTLVIAILVGVMLGHLV
jgi:hypothetical protein